MEQSEHLRKYLTKVQISFFPSVLMPKSIDVSYQIYPKHTIFCVSFIMLFLEGWVILYLSSKLLVVLHQILYISHIL
jgi:hypothetical protein